MKDRTTSICEQKRAWQVGRAMMFGPQRFSELLRFIPHHDALCRCLRKMTCDGLAKQLNDQRYELTDHGRDWIAAALPRSWAGSSAIRAISRSRRFVATIRCRHGDLIILEI
jgi:DNA-binding HxlR family transcriptional regulator